MAVIDKKLIHFINLATFEQRLNAGDIKDTSIVFIQDAKRIWTHGLYYSSPYTKEEIDQLFVGSNVTLDGYSKDGVAEIVATDTVNSAFGKVEDYLDSLSDLNAVLVDTGDVASDPIINDYIKPSDLSKVATSGSYNDLLDKPTIPSAVTESTVSGWGFTKNIGTYTKPTTGIPKSDLANDVQTSLGKADTALQSYTEKYTGTYSKPSTGIPKTDLASAVQISLGKADTAIQTHQDISGKADKSSLAAVATSGSYTDLSNKPTIPSAVTESIVSGWGFTKNTGTYSKPSGGIPKSDLVTEVLTSLNNADYYVGNNNVTSVTSIPVSKRLVIATISSSLSLSLASNLSAGKEVHIIIYNSGSSSISIALPNTGNYKCLVDTALSIDALNYAEINIISDGTNMYIRAI